MSEDASLKIDKEVNNTQFLGDIRFWVHRLRFNTSIKYIYLGLIIFYIFNNTIILKGYSVYFESNFFIDLIVLGVSLLAIHIANFCPKAFQELINENKNIFPSEEIYRNYINTANNTFKSKLEFYIPIILGAIYALGIFFYSGLLTNFEYVVWAGKEFYFEKELIFIYFLNSILISASYFVFFLIIWSGIIIIINTFTSLNKLGTEKFPLTVSYKDLKIGAFEKIGKFIIKLVIPIILLCSFISILGLYQILALDYFIMGYALMAIGLTITTLLAFLLYKNTIHIHDSILKFKINLKVSILNEIEIINTISLREITRPKKYQIIRNIHNYYHDVEKISDWPFNPSSIKKLAIVFGSSVLPILLSLFGLG